MTYWLTDRQTDDKIGQDKLIFEHKVLIYLAHAPSRQRGVQLMQRGAEQSDSLCLRMQKLEYP